MTWSSEFVRVVNGARHSSIVIRDPPRDGAGARQGALGGSEWRHRWAVRSIAAPDVWL